MQAPPMMTNYPVPNKVQVVAGLENQYPQSNNQNYQKMDNLRSIPALPQEVKLEAPLQKLPMTASQQEATINFATMN
jgi:hypothetical protein